MTSIVHWIENPMHVLDAKLGYFPQAHLTCLISLKIIQVTHEKCAQLLVFVSNF